MHGAPDPAPVEIREISQIAGMRAVEDLEQEVWQLEDRDVVPFTQLAASKAAGASLIGAYDRDALVGFAYAFPSIQKPAAGPNLVGYHSHMLAVKPSHRNLDVGYRLKLAQRDDILARGINRITWTFDPLQSLNAHFNFGKLGVFADDYRINFYGEETSSFLHRNGTDRLWVTWLLDSERVMSRIQAQTAPAFTGSRGARLLEVNSEDGPRLSLTAAALSQPFVFIDIPGDINEIQGRAPDISYAWRQAARAAFKAAISAGYIVEEFHRSTRAAKAKGTYLLRSTKSEFVVPPSGGILRV